MATSNFGPVFLIVSAALVTGTWFGAPILAQKCLSPAARDSVCGFVAKIVQHPLSNDAAQTQAPAEAKSTPAGQAGTQKSSAAPTAAAVQKTAKPAAPAKKVVAEEDPLPVSKGIERSDPRMRAATWGIIQQAAKIAGSDGTILGHAKPGQIFMITDRKANTDRTYNLTGRFAPDTFKRTVIVNSRAVMCFTGSPKNLTQNQHSCLRNYYELYAKAMARKAEIQQANAAKSPYAQQAAETLQKFKTLAAKVKKSEAGESSDENRKATYELTQLRSKLQDLTDKHKAWKESHASQLANPDKDTRYLDLLKKADAYVEPIMGLTY